MYIIFIKNKETYIKYGEIISKLVHNSSLFFMLGDLGVGKTTLIKSIAGKITNYNSKIKSPSFKIIEKYESKKKYIYHMDLFKINNSANLIEKINDLNYLKNFISILIEWGDKIKINKFVPDIRIYIFYYSNLYDRLIIIKSKFINLKKLLG